jgi:hypothetical protein
MSHLGASLSEAVNLLPGAVPHAVSPRKDIHIHIALNYVVHTFLRGVWLYIVGEKDPLLILSIQALGRTTLGIPFTSPRAPICSLTFASYASANSTYPLL